MNAFRRAVFTLFLAAATNSGFAAEPIVLQGHTNSVTVVAWAADGKSIATAGNDRTIRLWDPVTGKQTATQRVIAMESFGEPVYAFSADLKMAVYNHWGHITTLTLADGKTRASIDPILDRGQASTFRPDVYALAFNPDGKRLASAGSVSGQGLPGGIVAIWDAETGKLIHNTDKLKTAPGALAWSPDGKLIAAGTNGVGGELPKAGEVWIWNAETYKPLHTFPVKPMVEYGEWASAADVTFSPDSKRIATPVTAGSRSAPAGLIIDDTGASIKVWDLESGKATEPVAGLKPSVGRVVYSPNGKMLATAGADKSARLWNAETGKELIALTNPERVSAVAFSPDGKYLATGCQDGSVRIWVLPTTK